MPQLPKDNSIVELVIVFAVLLIAICGMTPVIMTVWN